MTEDEELRRMKTPPSAETSGEVNYRGVSHEPKAEDYQTIRGVTFPVEPGSSRLRLEIDRKRALRRMKMDDRTLARFDAMKKRGDLT